MRNVFALALQLDGDQKFKDFLNYLAARWADEGDFEDLGDYLKAVQNDHPEAVKVLEEPFRVMFEAEGGFVEAIPRGDGVEFSLYVEEDFMDEDIVVISDD